jgi:hypothetical protein
MKKGHHHGGTGNSDLDAENTHLIPQAKLEQLQVMGSVTVWKVNGKFIRDWIFIDFTEGGNSAAYRWMPPNEIWLDDSVWIPDEHEVVLLHEITEYNLMKNKGWTYDQAHDEASANETHARRNPGLLPELLAAEAAKAGANTSKSKISAVKAKSDQY